MSGDPAGTYSLGHSDQELERLNRQGRLYAPITHAVFAQAGIGPGMHVIDVGCGAGDVSLLVAEMVGPAGSVLAIDRAPEALATTRRRAQAAGIGWIETAAHDLAAFGGLTRRYDAAVGRLVLCYIPECVALLRGLAAALRPGGILAFLEMDVSTAGSVPPSAMHERCNGWIIETMRRGGFEPDMGSKLYAAFAEAGLAAHLSAHGIVDGGPDSLTIPYIEGVLRSLLPMMERAGVATAEEIGIDTFAERCRSEPGSESRCFYLPRFTAAWARTPE